MIVQLATDLAKWFPDLQGRAIAVSEVDALDNKTNMPTLPICIVALIGELGVAPKHGGGRVELIQDVIIQFMYKPVKYNRADGAETPFYAFYDYEPLRNRLLTFLYKYRTPRNGGFSYQSMDVSSDEFAVHITFRYKTSEDWCPDPVTLDECASVFDGEPSGPFTMKIVGRVLQPRSTKPCDPCEDCEPEDPCDFARLRNPWGIND